MEIVIHGHHAVVSESLRVRAERLVRRSAERLARPVGANITFEDDGPVKRVELILHAPNHTSLVAAGEGRRLGPALTLAAAKLDAQIRKLRSAGKKQVRSEIQPRA